MLQIFISALDRFAQFFIAPLMKKNAMEREREAVDSEFEQALPSDYNRRQQGTMSKIRSTVLKWIVLQSFNSVLQAARESLRY